MKKTAFEDDCYDGCLKEYNFSAIRKKSVDLHGGGYIELCIISGLFCCPCMCMKNKLNTFRGDWFGFFSMFA